MDHKVSKDMISSGMMPSGEKTQEDLGRIQYGSNPSPSSLADAYKSMYEKKEEVINEHHKKDADGNTIPHEGEENIQEALPLLAIPAAKLAAGLLAKKAVAGAALKTAGSLAAKSIAKKGAIGAVKAGSKAFGAGLKKGVMTAGKTAGKSITTSGGKVVGSAGKVKQATGLAGAGQKTGAFVRSAGAAMKNNPMMTGITAMQAPSVVQAVKGPKSMPIPKDPRARMTGARTAGVYASADLFDIVKGQLLDEGIDEKDALKIMVELSQQDLKKIVDEGIMPSTLTGALVRGAATTAGLLAARQAGKKVKQKVDDAIDKSRDKSSIGGNTRPGADKIYFGK